MIMKRDLKVHLEAWKDAPDKKPVLLRGARQVGKSYLVRELGNDFKRFIEINFELNPGLKSIFEEDLNPVRIVRDISITFDQEVVPGETLLFFDEIQECPAAITALRYFYEKMPQMHVIAAGSLIDFILEEIGIPVGRITPLYLYPLSFLEFLSVSGHRLLRDEIVNHNPDKKFSDLLHRKLLRLLGEYMAIGGMPEAVARWIETGSLKKCMIIHQTLIDNYRQDFAKYAKKRNRKYVEMVFNAIPRLVGKKFVFSCVSPQVRSRELRPALELLAKAGVVHIIQHSASNGVPLGAEINPTKSKVIFLDVALAQSVLGMDYGQWILDPVHSIVNQGAITEAFVGQEMLAYSSPFMESALYYWVNNKKGSIAEVDYVTGINGEVVPIEVKSGKTGSLKSIQIFLNQEKNSDYGLHFSQRNYFTDKRVRQYPLYAIAAAIECR